MLELDDPAQLPLAEAKLQQSLAGRPDDADVLGGLGVAWMRQGRHAEAQAQFREAQARDPANSRWAELLTTSRYWGTMRKASDAFAMQDYARAETRLAEARATDPGEPAAWVLTGRVQAAQGRDAEAEQAWRQALVLEPSNAGAVQALATLYLRQGREPEAQALSARLAGTARQDLAGAMAAARADLNRSKADAALAQGRQDEAISLLEQAARDDRDDPWLRLRLARLYAARGDADRGDALFTALLARPLSPEDGAAARHAHALFQSGQERDEAALATLAGIAPPQRDASILELQRRLQVRLARQRAVALARQGDAV
ncbi:tetratricopeptide repeat protein, partial [Leptospira sp. SA-E8]|uniref:tetratricopeptide repeat protein n=1 Tax=Leptospira sp. SA-E8 TaxID=3422259 RepID=UPI003EBC2EA1